MTSLPHPRDVIPHSPPMVLLDEILEHTKEMSRCRVTLAPDSMFVSHGRVDALVSLEYMAQCVAVFAGLKRIRDDQPVTPGFLLGAVDFSLAREHFQVGDTLVIEAHLVFGGENELGVFDTLTKHGDDVVSKATLHTYQGSKNIFAQMSDTQTKT